MAETVVTLTYPSASGETLTVPAGVTMARFECWGGGEGGGQWGNQYSPGLGGIGGGYSITTMEVSPGQEFWTRIMPGGTKGNGNGSPGSWGGSSTVGMNSAPWTTFCAAPGGGDTLTPIGDAFALGGNNPREGVRGGTSAGGTGDGIAVPGIPGSGNNYNTFPVAPGGINSGAGGYQGVNGQAPGGGGSGSIFHSLSNGGRGQIRITWIEDVQEDFTGDVDADNLSAVGQDITLEAQARVSSSPASVSHEGQVVGMSAGASSAAQSGALSIEGHAPLLQSSASVSVEAQSGSYTGYSVSLDIGVSKAVEALAGQLAGDGKAISLRTEVHKSVASADLTLTGHEAVGMAIMISPVSVSVAPTTVGVQSHDVEVNTSMRGLVSPFALHFQTYSLRYLIAPDPKRLLQAAVESRSITTSAEARTLASDSEGRSINTPGEDRLVP